jgi:ribosomal protein S18 acetylase RimI-like enzyme
MVTAENAPARELYRSSGFADERILMTKRLAAVEGFTS